MIGASYKYNQNNLSIMELTVSTYKSEPTPEPSRSFNFKYLNDPLLNSNYKAVARKNLINSSVSSVFRKRQYLKFKQFYNVSAIAVILRLTVFIFTLSMIF